jgi:NTE family protein
MTTFEPSRPQDKVVILKRVPVFSACNDQQLHLIADRTRLVEYKRGEYVFREGDAANAFYIISTGRVRIFSDKEGGPEKTFAVLHNGDSFGEVSLLTGETHSATVQAINDALILQIEKKDFEDVINKIPSLVLYLSRSLSKRLRIRERGTEFSEATIVAIYSAATGVGRTVFASTLATMLRRETGREVALVDLSSRQEDRSWLYGPAGPKPLDPAVLTDASEESFERMLTSHPLGFNIVSAGELFRDPGSEQAIAPLLSFLANRFHYVLLDLPLDATPPVMKALTQSDVIYLMTDSERERVIRTSALIQQLQTSVGPVEQRIKVVLNLVEGAGERLEPAEIFRQLGQPAGLTLPHVPALSERLGVEEIRALLDDRLVPYTAAVRRTARELGGLLVGLALGSGAALGLAHIGVLKVIEREQIPIDIIAGTSIGALVGGLWASGKTAAELEQIAMEFKNPWDIRQLFILDFGIPIFSLIVGLVMGVGVGYLGGFWAGLLFGFMVSIALGFVLGPLAGGPIQGARLMQKLETDFGGKRFEDTWLPLKVVAANPMAREEVVFESGPIANAVRASVSIPGIFKPVSVMGKICLDGGVVSPIPVNVLKRYGANHVIAVNVFPTTPELVAHRQELVRRRAERDAQLASRSLPVRLMLRLRQELIRTIYPLVFDVIMRSMQFMEHQIAEVACREADLTLRPTVPGSHWLEFFNPEPFIRRGEEVALRHLPELKRIARGPTR